MEPREVLAELDSNEQGLTFTQIHARLREFGYNEISVKGESIVKKLLAPFLNVMIFVLILAVILSFWQNEILDGIIILITILINLIINWTQTFSTERILKSLREHDTQKISVRRNNHVSKIRVEDLVPGDIIYLSEGEKIPADARILEANNLAVNESMLTGESLPIQKTAEKVDNKREVYDQQNMLFSGGFVMSGTATAIVTTTGNNTEFGNLARLSISPNGMSPIQKKINRLVKYMIGISIGISAFGFTISVMRGIEFMEALRYVLALAVSAVPEGLPVAITVILVLGMRRMAKQKALVRNMQAIENIGDVTVIATDKTGTLTKNKLEVINFWSAEDKSELEFMAQISYAINHGEGTNDPLDLALEKFIDGQKITGTPIENILFNYETATSGNIWKIHNRKVKFLKGSPEKILKIVKIPLSKRGVAKRELKNMTSRGERVIAFCADKKLIGFVGIADGIRSTAAGAIKIANGAGITVKILTGDHENTAKTIAAEVGVAPENVYARVVPETKLNILQDLKKDNIVAMTGDGVNDTPALAKANIGIAMGSGSQFAKDASDIILLDDNFKTIMMAVHEGRVIIENIKRMLIYLIATNTGEILVSVGAIIVGMPLPLVAVQILWINLVTDSFMVIPLGLEPGNENIMKRTPNNPRSAIINKRQIGLIAIISILLSSISLITFAIMLQSHTVEYARTVVFIVLIVLQLAIAWMLRSMTKSVFTSKKRNKIFNLAMISSIIIQSIFLFSNLGNQILHIVSVDVGEVSVIAIIASLTMLATTELYKRITKK